MNTRHWEASGIAECLPTFSATRLRNIPEMPVLHSHIGASATQEDISCNYNHNLAKRSHYDRFGDSDRSKSGRDDLDGHRFIERDAAVDCRIWRSSRTRDLSPLVLLDKCVGDYATTENHR
jgi:hypothetical protein